MTTLTQTLAAELAEGFERLTAHVHTLQEHLAPEDLQDHMHALNAGTMAGQALRRIATRPPATAKPEGQ